MAPDLPPLPTSAVVSNMAATYGNHSSTTQFSTTLVSANCKMLKSLLGSKLAALITDLQTRLKSDPTTKAVVFSAWSQYLRLSERALQSAGIRCLLLSAVISLSQ
jgi:hypothetical protein